MDTDKSEETARAEARKKIEEREKYLNRYDRLALPLIILLALWGTLFALLPYYFGDTAYISAFWNPKVFYPNLGWWTLPILFGNFLTLIAMFAALFKVLHTVGPKFRPLATAIALALCSIFLIPIGYFTAFLAYKILIAVVVFPFTFMMIAQFDEFIRRLSLFDPAQPTDPKKKTRVRLQISTALVIAVLTALSTFFQIIPHFFALFGK